MKKYLSLVHELHSYFGLFISPFIIIFGISVLVLNHLNMVDKVEPTQTIFERRLKLDRIPYGTTDLATGKAIGDLLGITGEIDHVFKGKDNLSIGIIRPGLETNIKVNTLTDSVSIKQEKKGVLRATAYLHKMPGPHLAQFRKNAWFMKIWSILTDATVYLILFLTVSGIFLWYFLKMERKMGITATAVGAVVFITLLTLIL